MLKDIVISSYNHGWLSMDRLRSVFRELAMAAYVDTGEYKIPG
jgi:hypothetical protein